MISGLSLPNDSSSRLATLLRALILCLIAGPSAFAADLRPATFKSILAAIQGNPTERVHFKEKRTIRSLKKPLIAEGYLNFLPPDTLIKKIEHPTPIQYALSATEIRVTDEVSGEVHSLPNDAIPELSLIRSSLLNLLNGDESGLSILWNISVGGSLQHWHLSLTPRDGVAANIRMVEFDGQTGNISRMHIVHVDSSEDDLILSRP